MFGCLSIVNQRTHNDFLWILLFKKRLYVAFLLQLLFSMLQHRFTPKRGIATTIEKR